MQVKINSDVIAAARKTVVRDWIHPKRVSNENAPAFQAPSDGFILVECPNKIKKGRVFVGDSQYQTSGLVTENNSGIFPIGKGQKLVIGEIDPIKEGLQNLQVWF